MKISRKRQRFSILIASFVIIAMLFAVAKIQSSLSVSAVSDEQSESSEHFIYIFDNGEKTILKSSATTVEDVLKRADIKVDKSDIVEPGLDERINEEDFYINIYRSREVVVLDGNTKKYIKTAATEPETIAKAAGVKLLEADKVEITNYNNLLESGMTTAYNVVRAKTVKINYFGKTVEKRTQAKTVGDFLKELNITRKDSENWISLSDNVKITDGLSLSVYPQGKQTISIEEDLPYGTQTTYDYSVDYGTQTVVSAGENGKKTVTYEIEMKNGQEISRNYISEIITKEPVTEQLTVGMKVVLPPGSHQDWMASAGISASDYGYVNFIIEHESHWNPISKNKSSGATGLCQALPGKKMASAGADWETNPITQLRWCNGYATGRYGSWEKAYQFWISHRWW